jgi:hypothetical protein
VGHKGQFRWRIGVLAVRGHWTSFDDGFRPVAFLRHSDWWYSKAMNGYYSGFLIETPF